MKLGPFEITRPPAVQAAAAVPKPPREIGASGTINLSGFLQQLEYSFDLQGLQGIAAFEKMRSSDGSVQEALGHITAPIKNADWDIEAASDEPDDMEIAEACRCAFFEWMDQPFEEYLDQALDYLVYGHGVFEHVWHVVDDDVSYEDPETGDPVIVPARQYLTFKRFAQRLPTTIWKWNASGGELESIVQHVYRDGVYQSELPIPAERLVVYTHQRRGDDFTGRSLLRAAHKHWLLKELVEKIEIVALERHGVGTWIGYLPEDSRHDDAMMTRVEQILQNVRAGANGYIVAPFPKQVNAQAGGGGGLFEVVSPGGSMPDFKGAKEYHRGEIKGSILVRFSELGHSSVGARATGDTQSKIWYDALHAVARYFAAVNDEPIRMFVDANYPDVQKYPKLVARNIESRTLAEFADSISKLVASGAMEADQPMRKSVREVVGMPEEAPETQQNLDDQMQLELNPPQPAYPPPGTPAPQQKPNPMQNGQPKMDPAQQKQMARTDERLDEISLRIRDLGSDLGRHLAIPAPTLVAATPPPAPNVEVKFEDGAIQVQAPAAPEPPVIPAPVVTIEKGAVEVNVEAPAAPAPAPAPNVEVTVHGTGRRGKRTIHRDAEGRFARIDEETPDGTVSERVVRDSEGNITGVEEA